MRRALQLYNYLDDTVLHWLAHAIITPSSRAREEVELFFGGEHNLDELTLLGKWAARFLFALVSERWVEAQHGYKQRHLINARNGGIVHVAYTGVRNTHLQTS